VKQWIGRILAAAIIVTCVNDGGRFLIAFYKLEAASRQIAFEAGKIARVNRLQNSAWPTANAIAKDGGVEVTGYLQTDQGVVVATRAWVYGTWAVGPAYAALSRQPLSSPYPIDDRVDSSE
jgi:hypothetical protein